MSRTPTSAPTPGEGKSINGTRWSPLKAPEKQTIEQVTKLGESQQANEPLYRAFPLKQELPLRLPREPVVVDLPGFGGESLVVE